MKLVVIGGGSSYTPELIEGVIMHRDSLPVTEIVLVDVETGCEHVRINTEFARRMIKKAGLSIAVSYTFDRKEGLQKADFVLNQMRVGGLEARAKDERIPLKYGVVGQETTGPGGCFKAQRTIPVVLEVCRDIEEVCKDAWLINFTNPAGIVTEAVLKYTKVKCIGLCNVPINMQHDAAERLGVSPKKLDCRFVGLNHLSVMNRALYRGEDKMKEILEVSQKESIVKNIEKIDEMDRLAEEMGCMLSPYLQYFYAEKEMVAEEVAAAVGLAGTRAEQVKKVETELFLHYRDEKLKEKPEALSKRGGARYSEAAINLIDSIYNDRQDIQVVDVQNGGTISWLPDNVVIETNCVIGSQGAKPLAVEEVPQCIKGLIAQVKAYEMLTIEAAVEGDKRKLLLALLNNPLVHDVRDARGIMEEMLEAHRAFLPQYVQEA